MQDMEEACTWHGGGYGRGIMGYVRGIHGLSGRHAWGMGEACMGYVGGIYEVWGRHVWGMGEAFYGGGMYGVWERLIWSMGMDGHVKADMEHWRAGIDMEASMDMWRQV